MLLTIRYIFTFITKVNVPESILGTSGTDREDSRMKITHVGIFYMNMNEHEDSRTLLHEDFRTLDLLGWALIRPPT